MGFTGGQGGYRGLLPRQLAYGNDYLTLKGVLWVMYFKSCRIYNIITSVLIVDDSSLQRTIIEDALSDDFDIIGTAQNGSEAVEKYEEHKPDLITMDIMMPEMNGVEATRQITAQNDSVTVMMCTSVEQAEKVKEAVKAGADEYVTKPFESDDLLQTAISLAD